MKISIEEFQEKIQDGKIFGVSFVKKNGEIRNMQARVNVSALVKPAENRLDSGVRKREDILNSVLTVYDMNKPGEDRKGQFRRINLKTIRSVKIGGETYQIAY